ncbi:hypothetical protein B0H16DRAFT_1734441 [Mycena metata]|uniref:Uncharacterized protein n=1 Tax=Mycena metata TaxID=1033252 RepID=A0AAD7HUW2_9AGAR|nr:hypothetical protein B0H16DRAFT_1734441 [Mycena metata]
MSLSLIAANLATLALATLFYGIYLVLFFISIYLLLQRYNATHTSHKSRKNNSMFRSIVFISAICLFIVVTAHWATVVYRAFVAFVVLRNETDSDIFLNDHNQITETMQNTLLGVAILIGDSLIIHRLWVVWTPNKLVIVVPAVSLLALSVCTFVSTKITSQSSDVFGNPLLKSSVLLTLITNVYCTGKSSSSLS